MASQAVGGGTLAAAVLGVGTAASTASTAGNGAGTSETVRASASQFANELARTGASSVTLAIVLGAILLLAGLLVMGLARRHGVKTTTSTGFGPPRMT